MCAKMGCRAPVPNGWNVAWGPVRYCDQCKEWYHERCLGDWKGKTLEELEVELAAHRRAQDGGLPEWLKGPWVGEGGERASSDGDEWKRVRTMAIRRVGLVSFERVLVDVRAASVPWSNAEALINERIARYTHRPMVETDESKYVWWKRVDEAIHMFRRLGEDYHRYMQCPKGHWF